MPLSDEPGNLELGVLLFNLGGPESLADVRPFLLNLFSDPDIIRIKNKALRCTLAWLIATTRQRKSRSLYRQIGRGSPLRRITEAQAAALSGLLAARGCRAGVYVGSLLDRSFASPQSITMVSPKSPTITLAGLRSRWMMLRPCA